MPGEHLTFRQIESYAARQLAAEEIPAFHRHAETCPECRETLRAVSSGLCVEHVSEQDAVDFVAGLLPPKERQRVAAHRLVCASCSAALADLEEFRQIETPRRSIAWALPIAAAVFLTAGISFWLTRPVAHLQPKTVASLRDESSVLQLTAEGKLLGNPDLPAQWAGPLAAALKTGTLPEGPAALPSPPRETLRSIAPTARPVLTILSPNGTRVLSDRPDFRWTPVAGASAYQVVVVDEYFNEVANSGPIHTNSWVATAPLPRLKVLMWQVSVKRGGEWTVAPAPPEPTPNFEIVSQETEARILAARQAAKPSHLLLAVLYSQAGMPKEAALELDALAAMNPGSSLPLQLRKSLGTSLAK